MSTHEPTNPTESTEPNDCLSLKLADGSVVIYDLENDDQWIQCDDAVSLASKQ